MICFRTSYLNAFVIAFCALCSCSVEELEYDGVVKTKRYQAVCGNDLTKVSLIPGNDVLWSEGDWITYYRYNSGTLVKSDTAGVKVTVNRESIADVPVIYTSGEDKLLAYTKGKGTGKVSSFSYASFTVENGINSVQDGTFASNIVSKAEAELDGDDVLEFKHQQSFITFSIEKENVILGSFNKIVVEAVPPAGGSAVNIAGDYEYAMAGTPASSDIISNARASKTITISGAVTKSTTYYVAIKPGTYDNGLRIKFYDGGNMLQFVETKSITIDKGTIVKLGSLEIHKKITGKSIPKYCPSESSIVWKGDLHMSKKLWLNYTPADMTGVKWTIDEAWDGSGTAVTPATKVATVAANPNKEDYDIDGDGTKETDCLTAIVTPTGSYTHGRVKVKAALHGEEAVCYFTVNIGDVVDLGLSVYWAGTNMTGSLNDGSLALEDNVYVPGGYYQWGKVNASKIGVITTTAEYCWPGGEWTAGSEQKNYGGRYNKKDLITTLIQDDDVVYQYGKKIEGTSTKWRMPTASDYKELINNCSVQGEFANGYGCNRMYSKKAGFTDVYVAFVFAGELMNSTGAAYMKGGNNYYWSSSLYTGAAGTDGANCVLGGIWFSPATFTAYQQGVCFCQQTNPTNASYPWRYFGFSVRGVQEK